MHERSLAALAAGLRAREFSSEELTRHHLARIARLGPALNAFITVDEQKALAAALPQFYACSAFRVTFYREGGWPNHDFFTVTTDASGVVTATSEVLWDE